MPPMLLFLMQPPCSCCLCCCMFIARITCRQRLADHWMSLLTPVMLFRWRGAELVSNIESCIAGESEAKMHLYSGHDTTVLPLLAGWLPLSVSLSVSLSLSLSLALSICLSLSLSLSLLSLSLFESFIT